MKKATKTLLLMLCAVVLVVSSILGTVAYLTSEAEVKNTFTVGKVEIELKETNQTTRSDGTVGLDLHLVPGIPQTKDPTVTVKQDSEDCYVRAIVTVNVPNIGTNLGDINAFANNFANNYFKTTGDAAGFNTAWTAGAPTVSGKTITFVVNYNGSYATEGKVTKTGANKELESLFDKIQAPNTLTSAQFAELAGMTIDVKAHAIQADSFADADAAWSAFATQNP